MAWIYCGGYNLANGNNMAKKAYSERKIIATISRKAAYGGIDTAKEEDEKRKSEKK